jgi:hypothetical protein
MVQVRGWRNITQYPSLRVSVLGFHLASCSMLHCWVTSV